MLVDDEIQRNKSDHYHSSQMNASLPADPAVHSSRDSVALVVRCVAWKIAVDTEMVAYQLRMVAWQLAVDGGGGASVVSY